jgi:hypothetical protein
MSYQQAHFECYKHSWKSSLSGCIYCINLEKSAEIERLKEAAIELLDALSEEQYSTTPPKAWPTIAPAANRLSDLVTRLEDS